ncbi:hypothetical protein [Mongoliimonas terrestris]|nr:hypothetical protein [Mongoliimonas terrestris]
MTIAAHPIASTAGRHTLPAEADAMASSLVRSLSGLLPLPLLLSRP